MEDENLLRLTTRPYHRRKARKETRSSVAAYQHRQKRKMEREHLIDEVRRLKAAKQELDKKVAERSEANKFLLDVLKLLQECHFPDSTTPTTEKNSSSAPFSFPQQQQVSSTNTTTERAFSNQILAQSFSNNHHARLPMNKHSSNTSNNRMDMSMMMMMDCTSTTTSTTPATTTFSSQDNESICSEPCEPWEICDVDTYLDTLDIYDKPF